MKSIKPLNVLLATALFTGLGFVSSRADTIFVSNAAGGNFESFDTTTGSLLNTVSTPVGPLGVAADSSGDLFVMGNNKTIYEYTNGTGTPTIVGSIAAASAGIALNPAGTSIYAANFTDHSGGVSTVDIATSTASTLATNSAWDYSNNVAFYGGDLYLLTANDPNGSNGSTGSSVYVLNPTTGSIISSISTDMRLLGLAFNSAGNLYLSGTNPVNSQGEIEILTLQSGAYTYSSTLDSQSVDSNLNDPYSLAFDSKGNLFADALNSNKILEYTNGVGSASVFETSANGLNVPAFLAIEPALAVPEPGTTALLGVGFFTLILVVRRRMQVDKI